MNKEQSILGRGFSGSVYNTMYNHYAAEQSTFAQSEEITIEAAEDFLLSFMWKPKHRIIMLALFKDFKEKLTMNDRYKEIIKAYWTTVLR